MVATKGFLEGLDWLAESVEFRDTHLEDMTEILDELNPSAFICTISTMIYSWSTNRDLDEIEVAKTILECMEV